MRSQSKTKQTIPSARSSSKIKIKPRGYYYSSNNPRRTKSKAEISTVEAFPTPMKLKWDNDLELYSKNTLLINWFDKETSKYAYLLNVYKEINKSIGDIIIKPKIKIYEIDKKKQNEKLKKEKEDYEFQKNMANKIDDALMKANMALESIKMLGKQKKSNQNSNPNSNLILPPTTTEPILKQPKEKNEIVDIIEKCQDKYVSSIETNQSNYNKYFSTLANNRKLFKISKEKSRRMKQKNKNIGNIFDDIYTQVSGNNNKMDIEQQTSNDLSEENIILQVSSLLNSGLFTKLFIKVLYDDLNPSSIETLKNKDEEIIYNAFSLWYLIHYMNNTIQTHDKNNDIILQENYTEVFKQKNNIENYFSYSESKFIDEYIHSIIQKFIENLNSKDQGNKELNENEIFTNDFYKLYQNLSKVEKIKCIDYIASSIDQKVYHQEPNSNINVFTSKEELNLFKNIQSIFKNNGSYCCNICTK